MSYRGQRNLVFSLLVVAYFVVSRMLEKGIARDDATVTAELLSSDLHLHHKYSINNNYSPLENVLNETIQGTHRRRYCIAVLTGHPRTNRKHYVERLLRNLQRDVIGAADVDRDVRVYCDGVRCGSLVRDDDDVTALRVSFHGLQTPPVDRGTTGRRGDEVDGRLFVRYLGLNETVRLSGVEFQRHRWLYVSRNYRRMFDDLFLAARKKGSLYDHCVILEDDLILSPDSLLYLTAVQRLMDVDRTVFTGSLFADNSYPLYASDTAAFRRVSHFAGLGFIMSRRWYLTELRRTWSGLQNWDETVQRLVARQRLASIVPEVSRALHLRRIDGTTDENWSASNHQLTSVEQRFKVPRHPFESALLNRDVLPDYDDVIGRLRSAVYDNEIVDVVRRADYIRFLGDALFFADPSRVLVYWGCTDDGFDLHRLLVDRGLWGAGNGGVVRGSYRGTLLFRYFSAQVLVVSENSEFGRMRIDKPEVNISAFVTRLPGQPEIERQHAGAVYRLNVDFRVEIGRFGQSCDSACAELDRKCDVTGMWLLNENCDVMRHFVPGCRTCFRSGIENYGDGALPALVAGDGDECLAAYPHYISCSTASTRYRRLCVCQTDRRHTSRA